MSDPDVSFASLGLPAVMVHALRGVGVHSPFPIQTATIPDVLAGRDVLGRGPTGSGKTLAFGLPMLVRLRGSASRPSCPRGLILAPTRELALQIERDLEEPARSVGVRVAALVGGVPLKRQIDRLTRGVDVVVATPGRLVDHLDKGSISLDAITITTVDEADHLAELGFVPQIRTVLDATAVGSQRLLFSATLDDAVDALIGSYLRDPILHTTSAVQANVPEMTHFLFHVVRSEKQAVVAEIASRAGRTLLFVRTREGVDDLAARLRGVGVPAGALHGEKTQTHRNQTLSSFAQDPSGVLVCTDVAARGIHVDDVSLVVHVDPPLESKDYVHRAGRTARAGEAGTVVTLVTEDELPLVTRMLDRAGVDIIGFDVAPGGERLRTITGARSPSGTPVVPVPSSSPPSTPRSGRDARGAGKDARRRAATSRGGLGSTRYGSSRGRRRRGPR
ncbi:DEAD/DEAH box helicase [Rhodococcus sp. NPDC058521]|uniref:DEAD/DEAH box helicase n=1 Tax=Rhodococcus sp. NPDC058521 TaxID=3346536 RepID=UPI00364A429C